MSAITKIQWTDRTWNPVRGCSLVSEGCRNCYAMKDAHRFSWVSEVGPSGPYAGLTEIGPNGPRWNGRIRTVDEALTEPLRWGLKKEPCEPCMGSGSVNDWRSCAACGGRGWVKRGLRIFVNSMSDLFHEGVSDAFIERVFAVMALAPRHTFQILTKRPDRMRAFLAAGRDVAIAVAAKTLHTTVRPFALPSNEIFDERRVARGDPWQINAWPLPNVWLGVSCENQQTADERIPLLLNVPAAIRFISVEPLLGPVDLTTLMIVGGGGVSVDALANGPSLDWAIVGGESGPCARPCEIAWIRSIVERCRIAAVPCFVKQLGADARGICDWEHHDECPPKHLDRDGVLVSISGRPGTLCHAVDDAWWPCRLKLKNRKGGEMSEWSEDLRVRQFPTVE